MVPRRLKVAAALVGITTALALVSVLQTVARVTYQGRRLPWGEVVVVRLIDWYTCLIFLPVLYWLVRRLQSSRASWPRTISALLLASVLVSFAKYTIFFPLQRWISTDESTTLAGILSGNVIVELMIFWAVIAIMYGFEYYRQFKDRERVQLQLERRLSEMQLEALRAQLHPHFLFNTLNAIATVLHRDPERADKAIVNLAELLRAVTEQRDREEIPLDAELDLARRYLDIMSLRSGESLRVTWSIAQEARNATVPYFILQPLLENALEHGFGGQPDSGHLDVSARVDNNVLLLVVEDDGAGIAAASTNGIGLSATSQRLSELYGPSGRLTLEDGSNGGSRVIVEIPLRHSSAAA
ncbi:MAG: sensor histidine kinase [Gemmatimonadaceae bacterium]